MTEKFRKAYAYAQANGYKGTYEEYIRRQYDAYAVICERYEVQPMPYDQWLSAQDHM